MTVARPAGPDMLRSEPPSSTRPPPPTAPPMRPGEGPRHHRGAPSCPLPPRHRRRAQVAPRWPAPEATQHRRVATPPTRLVEPRPASATARPTSCGSCGDTRVPLTSNDAERPLRPARLHDKISGTFRSSDHAEALATTRSYIQAAAKHDKSLLHALIDPFTTGAWLPPDPAPTCPPREGR